MESPKFKRALISVSDKTGLVEFAQGLVSAGVEIYSTGGTRKVLEEAGLTVVDISTYTGFPEMMDGRLKTLHPKVFGGLLCRHDRDDDMSAIAEHGIETFELVVVNLYPFEETVAQEGVTLEQAIEKIDIGGPSLIRAAAKNQKFTSIATSAGQYNDILAEVQANGCTSQELRTKLALAAFERTAAYDRAIADYFGGQNTEDGFPASLSLSYERRQTLRYGENPHQKAAFYVDPTAVGANLSNAEQLNGKELSYNNLLDLDAALTQARAHQKPAAVVLKHNNPCGGATAEKLVDAFLKAYEGDPLSAFGGIIGFNRVVDGETADQISEPGRFIEAIIAPDFSPEALEILTTKPKWKANVRLMKVGDLSERDEKWDIRRLDGGLLVQSRDIDVINEDEWEVVTETQPTPEQLEDLKFGWEMVRHVKSNAILLAKDCAIIGVGAGQMSRVDSVEISIKKAGDRVQGSVLASDAFFPFADSIEAAAAAGVTAFIEPGGSRRDQEVIDACNKHGLPMIFTKRRHFKH